MAYIAWDNQQFCTPLDVDKIAPLSGLAPATNSVKQNELVAQAIQTGKDRLKRIILFYAQKAFPVTVDQLLAMQNAEIRGSIDNFNAALRVRGAEAGTINWNFLYAFGAVWFDAWLGSFGSQRPRAFFESGTHDATLYAGSADRGDFLGNSLTRFVYVNNADKPSVDWVQFDHYYLLDYVANPDALKDANVYAAIEAALENSALTQTSRDVVEKNLGLLDSHFVKKVKCVIEECMQNVKFAVGNVAASDIAPYNANKFSKTKYVSIG